MKTYEQHNSDNLTEGWEAVEEYLQDALSISWDGCHKIYLAMDEDEHTWFCENYEITRHGSPEELLGILQEWWDSSCSLRFISAVSHNSVDPNDGFVSLISQFANDGEESCPLCEETWCDGSCEDDEDEDDDNEDEEV